MDDQEFLAEFLDESLAALAVVERHLLRLESAGSIDQDVIDEIFRSVHSIKGGGGFLGLDRVVTLAHHGEALMDEIRKGRMELTAPVADILLAAIDGLRALLEEQDAPVEDLCERLQRAIRSQEHPTDDERPSLAHAQGQFDFQIEAPLGHLQQVADCADGIVEGFSKIGEVLYSSHDSTSSGKTGDVTQRVTLRVRTPLPQDIVSSLYGLSNEQIVAVEPHAALPSGGPNAVEEGHELTGSIQALMPTAQDHKVASETTQAEPRKLVNKEASEQIKAPAVESSVRVSTRFLDELLEATGNMVMARNQMLSRYQFQDDVSFAVLSRCITDVHKNVVQQRMQSIGSLFDRFRRPVRDLANKLGKEVEFQSDGNDIELDRTIVEAFADPLNHMVRNAVDHAIELPEERVAKGKGRIGRIILRAYHQSGEVIVEIEDDGAGIDHQRVLAKAIEKGVVSADRGQHLRQREIVNLIFEPGFSTKDQSTDVSGRGVGMDVVKTNVERIGGAVEVHTNLGVGTIFAFRLPLTQTVVSSSLISAIIIEVAGQRFVLPQTAVNEIIQVDPQNVNDRIKQLDGEDVYQLRDKVLAIVHLEDCLSLQRTFRHPKTGRLLPDRRSRIADRREQESPDKANRFQHQRSCIDRRRNRQTLIVLEYRRALFGIMVDRVVGVEEVVVRSTPRLLEAVSGFCGHTVLGDGSVVMMLDVAGIVCKRGLRLHDLPEHRIEARSALKTAQQMVTFENAHNEFFAIPLMMVTLIEQIRGADIHRVGSREYYQLKDQTIPLLRLEQFLDVTPYKDVEVYHLILPARVPKPIGILAGGNMRIADFSESFDGNNDSKSGVVGTAFFDGQVVTLLDLYALVERAMPEAFAELKRAGIKGVTRILLAEDNKFFAKLVSSYLQLPNLELTVVEDGQEAWDLLSRERRTFDVVISDIEMPRMNGFELVQRIKSDPDLRHTPVLALTSLADEDSRRRGLKAGFDEYAVKIDKHDLLAMVHRLIAALPRFSGEAGGTSNG